MERGAPLARTPLTSTWSGADTGSVSRVSATTAEDVLGEIAEVSAVLATRRTS
jgi:hypothetical protein